MLPYSVILASSNTPQIIIVGDAIMPKSWQKPYTSKWIATLQSSNRHATVISSKSSRKNMVCTEKMRRRIKRILKIKPRCSIYLLELTKINRNVVKKATAMKNEKLKESMKFAEKIMTFILSSKAMIFGEKVSRKKKGRREQMKLLL